MPANRITKTQEAVCAFVDEALTKRELLAYQAELKLELFRSIRKLVSDFKKDKKFNQNILAKKIGMDKGQLSRQLQGKNDLRIETLSDLARGLDCRITFKLESIYNIPLSYSTSSLVTVNDPSPSYRSGLGVFIIDVPCGGSAASPQQEVSFLPFSSKTEKVEELC